MRISSIGCHHVSDLFGVERERRRAYRRVKVHEEGARHVFAVARLVEEGLESAALSSVLTGIIGASVGLETVFQEVAA